MPMGLQSGFLQSHDDAQGWFIDNWCWGAINWTSSAMVSWHSVPFCIMVNSIETNSTKSSIISGRAVSLKKLVWKGVKDIAWSFKKLKKSISTASTYSIYSLTSITDVTSNNENADHGNEPSANSQGDSSESEPEVELTHQEELSTLLNHHLIINTNSICVRGTAGALALTHLHLLHIWCPFPVPWWLALHFFACATSKCKVHAGGVCRYQDLKDKASTTNFKHPTCCFGSDAVNASIARKEHTNHNSGIFSLFACKGKQPVKYLHHVHTNPEVWCVPLLYINMPMQTTNN